MSSIEVAAYANERHACCSGHFAVSRPVADVNNLLRHQLQIIKDTKRTDFYLDAQSALDYGLIDQIVAGELPAPKPSQIEAKDVVAEPAPSPRLEEVAPAAKAPTDS